MMHTTFTDAQDKWLNENVNQMGRKWNGIADAFNSTFGTTRTKDSLRRRSNYLLIPNDGKRYTKEQDEWIVSHAYLDRKTMSVQFEKKFGVIHSVSSISSRCSKLKAYKLIEVTGEYKSHCVWTNEIDQWLIENARKFRGRHGDLVKELNHSFGTKFTERAVNFRKWGLGIKTNGFYRHEDHWLLEHRDLCTRELTIAFNGTFHECRSYGAIEKHLARLKRKALPDEREAVKNASDGLDGEITPPNEIKQGETIL